MESAIDKYLKCPRTLSRRVHDDYKPPFPMFVGRADENVKQVVMAYLGVQFRDEQRAAPLFSKREPGQSTLNRTAIIAHPMRPRSGIQQCVQPDSMGGEYK